MCSAFALVLLFSDSFFLFLFLQAQSTKGSDTSLCMLFRSGGAVRTSWVSQARIADVLQFFGAQISAILKDHCFV